MKKLAGGLALAAAMALAAGPAAADKPYTLKQPPGKYCQGQSKKKRAGQKKSDFATCVTNMAKLNKNNNLTAAQVCKGMDKKKHTGQKRSAYSLCISGAKKAKNDLGS
jgi:hypothetical protein